jgi:hypothetical protein
MTIIPFNFGKEIGRKDMSAVNEDNIEENEIEEEEKEWTNSFYGYEYKEIVPAENRAGPILAIKIETHIHKDKLDILEKIVRLKYGTRSGTFRDYIDEALVSQVEADLRSSDLAQDFC